MTMPALKNDTTLKKNAEVYVPPVQAADWAGCTFWQAMFTKPLEMLHNLMSVSIYGLYTPPSIISDHIPPLNNFLNWYVCQCVGQRDS